VPEEPCRAKAGSVWRSGTSSPPARRCGSRARSPPLSASTPMERHPRLRASVAIASRRPLQAAC
jgi:hypothetical protein